MSHDADVSIIELTTYSIVNAFQSTSDLSFRMLRSVIIVNTVD